jgi:DNA polymerase-4
MYDAVRGIDPSPVSPAGQKQPAISGDHEFGNDTNDVSVVEGALYRLVEKTGADLRERRLSTRRVKVVLNYSDGKRIARHGLANPATANDFRLFVAAKRVLERAWKRRVRIRHIRLICDRLTYPPAQIGLFAEHEEEKKASDNLVTALDTIRRRFGFNAIHVGRTL